MQREQHMLDRLPERRSFFAGATAQRYLALLLSCQLALACGSDGGGDDAASGDAAPDAGAPEGGAPDAGLPDGAPTWDASVQPPEIVPATTLSGIELRLDEVLYDDGDAVDVSLSFAGQAPSDESLDVVLSAPDSRDVEPVTLKADADGIYRATGTIPVRRLAGAAAPADGTLTIDPGEAFYALYFPDRSAPPLDDVEAGLIVDVGFLRDPDATAAVIEPRAALTSDEVDPPAGGRPVGTLLTRGGPPVQIATEQVIYYPRDDAELARFLEETGGESLKVQALEPSAQGPSYAEMHLVAVQPPAAAAADLAVLRSYLGETDDLMASKPEVLALLGYVESLRLDGYLVAVNPRLQYQAAPTINDPEAVTHTMSMTRAVGASAPCIPGDPARVCVESAPATWAFTALWDVDDARIDAAVLDMGFAPNDDFRRPASGALVQCDMTAGGRSGYTCEAGAAEGAPTVGNSFFGDRSWHGTGVASTLGGIVDNGFGAAGIGGQVAVPQLYKYDTESYAFEFGQGIRLAVSQGAECINISAGYPCRVLTNGPDFEICTVGGRASACALITAGASAAAAAVCAATSWVPIVGPIACTAALSAVAAEVAACTSTLAFGNVRGPIESAVTHAARAGVPVVTIAGNRINAGSLPDVIGDFVELGNQRTEDWAIVPAMAPEAIVVAAADENLDNAHFFGDRVDIWAPILSAYVAPDDVNDPASALVRNLLGGTSGAAPYITGLIALMQAVNPELNPSNASLSDTDRRGIVERLRALLTDDAHTFSNAELVAMGYTDQPVERRLLIDPIAALRAAAAPALPDLSGLGYDTSLNFSEVDGDDDTQGSANALSVGSWASGTILSLPAEGGTAPPEDIDWYEFTMPTSAGALGQARVRLRYPRGYDPLYVDASNLALISRVSGSVEDENVYRVIAPGGDAVAMSVQGAPGMDNVYRLQVDQTERAEPWVTLVEPSAPTGTVDVCAFSGVSFRADVLFPLFPAVVFPSSTITWWKDGVIIDYGPTTTESFAAGTYQMEVRVYNDPALADSVTISATDCVGDPPSVSISQPASDVACCDNAYAFDGFDSVRSQWYKDVTVVGSGTDTEDGTLPGSALVWKTDRTDLQSEVLGTGSSVTVRLYSDTCSGTQHTIRLEAVDSDGNPAAPVSRTIYVWTLC